MDTDSLYDRHDPDWFQPDPERGTYFDFRYCPSFARTKTFQSSYPLQVRSIGRACLTPENTFGPWAWAHPFLIWSLEDGGFLDLHEPGSGRIALQAGSALIIASGQIHSFGARQDCDKWSYRWITFEGPCAQGIPNQLSLNTGEKPIDMFDTILTALAQGHESAYRQAVITGFELITLCCRQRQSEAVDQLALKAMNKIQDNFTDPDFSVNSLARSLDCHRAQLSRQFQNTHGLPPQQVLFRLRLERARELLLKTKQSVADVAIAAGFGTADHFSRTFKRQVGVTPSSYRLRTQSKI